MALFASAGSAPTVNVSDLSEVRTCLGFPAFVAPKPGSARSFFRVFIRAMLAIRYQINVFVHSKRQNWSDTAWRARSTWD